MVQNLHGFIMPRRRLTLYLRRRLHGQDATVQKPLVPHTSAIYGIMRMFSSRSIRLSLSPRRYRSDCSIYRFRNNFSRRGNSLFPMVSFLPIYQSIFYSSWIGHVFSKIRQKPKFSQMFPLRYSSSTKAAVSKTVIARS